MKLDDHYISKSRTWAWRELGTLGIRGCRFEVPEELRRTKTREDRKKHTIPSKIVGPAKTLEVLRWPPTPS